MIDVSAHPNGHLASPVRNRYFYGKLLDVEQLEREQHYFVEGSRLINRLTLGAGVLCGLSVRERNGNVVIGPGVAVDGFGREIVVTDPLEVEDPWTLTDESGDPTGETRENGPVVLCLAYYECLVDPAPALVVDCEVREVCEHGAVRERYRLLVHSPDDVELPPEPCAFLPAREPEPVREGWRPPLSHLRSGLREGLPREIAGEEIVRAFRRAEAGLRPVDRPTGLRERLCALLQQGCGPGPHCVPLALVTRDENEAVVVDPCAVRTTIYSNAALLELILCLAEQMERCCDRRVTMTAPVIKELYPGPADVVKADELRDRLDLEEGGIAVSFSREMNADRLNAPDDWLRLVALVSLTVEETTATRALPLRVELERTVPASLERGLHRVLPVPADRGDRPRHALDGLRGARTCGGRGGAPRTPRRQRN